MRAIPSLPPAPALDPSLPEALRHLERGEVIVHPTESVYGFGGFLDDGPLAVLQSLKGRTGGGFVVLIPSAGAIAGRLGPVGRTLADALWPGPLTLAVDDCEDLFCPAVQGPDGSVAVRVPGHEGLLRLLGACGRPMTSSSANAPGLAPALTVRDAREAARARGHDLFALDGGNLAGGAASTIVRVGRRKARLIREGAIPAARLSEIVPVIR